MSSKIFVSMACLSFAICCSSLFFVSRIYQKHLKESFENRYITFTKTLADTLTQLEIKSDNFLRLAGDIYYREDQNSGPLSEDELKSLRDKLEVTHLFATNAKGIFTASTNEDPSKIPNIFTFCPEYSEKFQEPGSFVQTPIIPPYPEPKPYKFRILRNHDGNRLLELGLRVDYIGSTIARALSEDKNLIEVSIYTPNGVSLGSFQRDRVDFAKVKIHDTDILSNDRPAWDDRYVYFSQKAGASQPFCCQCVIAGLINEGLYHYFVLVKISTEEFETDTSQVNLVFLIVSLLALLVSLLISQLISRKIIERLKIFEERIVAIRESGDLSIRTEISGKDEVGTVARKFDSLLASLQSSRNQLTEKEKEAEKNAAIAKVVKTVAHDLRSPFSVTESLITSVQSAESIEELREVILPSLEGEVINAKRKAERLLGDLLDYNEDISLERQDFSIKNLIRETLQEISGTFEKSKITIKCEFKHLNLLNCDEVRINQILSNIFTNAVQAMKGRGSIWIKTASFGGHIEIVLGNDNSHIDKEDLTKVFDEDYTKGKKGGHGLGLAICKKMAELHGGRILVKSCPEIPCVEFTLSLPETNRADKFDSDIPDSFKGFRAYKMANADHEQVKRNERTARLARLIDKKGEKFLVGLLDDEKIYFEHITKLIDRYPYRELIDLRYFTSSEDLIFFIETKRLDFLISDIDLGEETNGYDVIKILRNELSISEMPICVHSNRSGRVGMKFSWQAGGDFLVPKPMTIDHLLIFLTGDYKEVSEKMAREKGVSENLTHRGIDKDTEICPQ